MLEDIVTKPVELFWHSAVMACWQSLPSAWAIPVEHLMLDRGRIRKVIFELFACGRPKSVKRPMVARRARRTSLPRASPYRRTYQWLEASWRSGGEVGTHSVISAFTYDARGPLTKTSMFCKLLGTSVLLVICRDMPIKTQCCGTSLAASMLTDTRRSTVDSGTRKDIETEHKVTRSVTCGTSALTLQTNAPIVFTRKRCCTQFA